MSNISTHLADFNGYPLEIVDHNGQQWLTSEQIGLALGFKEPRKSINKTYNRHADEFTEQMVGVVNLGSPSGTQETRIFSPRGAHLLAMWSQTDRAKTFRVWLLDVLESEQKALPQTSPTEKKLKIALLKARPEFKQVSHYLNKQLSVREIALLLECSQHRVSGIKTDMVDCGLLEKKHATTQLCFIEKQQIKHLHHQGKSFTEISAITGRAASTVSRFLEREKK